MTPPTTVRCTWVDIETGSLLEHEPAIRTDFRIGDMINNHVAMVALGGDHSEFFLL
jgi:hypothetical protein